MSATELADKLFKMVEHAPPGYDEVHAQLVEEITKLEDKSNELSALESAGVDNWSGYSERWDILKEYWPETYERLWGGW